MVGRVLVTTALEETWPTDGSPVLFLGEWCRLYGRKSVWKDLDAEVAPYHWDNREKLHADYKYLNALYEKLLVRLAEKLNTIHEVDNTVHYWRILVGPWLGYFIQMVFDRWYMLKGVIETGEVSKCTVYELDVATFTPNDFADFNKLFIGDVWNETIYRQIIEMCWPETVQLTKLVKNGSLISGSHIDKKNGTSTAFRQHLRRLLTRLNKYFTRNSELFFISSYLPLKTDLLLQLKLGQFPKIWSPIPVPQFKFDRTQRQWELDACQSPLGSFEWMLSKLIAQHIPLAYLEGYHELVNTAQKLPWPKNPKAIFTSNAYLADDIFKIWAAEKKKKGLPLIIGQHGGHFGMTQFAFHEEHQIKIADRWISWGWRDANRRNIKPIGNLKSFGRMIGYDPQGGALMVETTVPQQSYHLYAAPIARQYLDYFDDQKKFLNSLPKALSQQVLLRLYAQDYGWEQKLRWMDTAPDTPIDDGRRDIRTLIGKSRLYVSTYNATTYLESMTWNIPTIMFWNPAHWELNDEAIPYFNLLKSAGIFHETPESAAEQMVKVWDNVAGWWQSPKVQDARRRFCEQYARIPDNPLGELVSLFKSVQVLEEVGG